MTAAQTPHKQSHRFRLRFSLKALLTIAFVVSAYYAGRAPMLHRVQQAEHERDDARKLAEQTMQRNQELQFELQFSRRHTIQGIEAGMMIEALEHQMRYAPPAISAPVHP